MHQVNIHEAKTHLSRLIEEARRGEDVVIAKNNVPVVRLTVLPEARSPRRIGGLHSILLHMSDDFDEPLGDFAEYSA
jgi:prevent-host-death family protein